MLTAKQGSRRLCEIHFDILHGSHQETSRCRTDRRTLHLPLRIHRTPTYHSFVRRRDERRRISSHYCFPERRSEQILLLLVRLSLISVFIGYRNAELYFMTLATPTISRKHYRKISLERKNRRQNYRRMKLLNLVGTTSSYGITSSSSRCSNISRAIVLGSYP